jgi:prophage tail gpP-like protein
VVRELGIKQIEVRAGSANKAVRREKISVEPGDSAWSVLSHAAEAVGLWPWFDPDGTLVIGGPDYTAPVVASLVMNRNGRGNNLQSLSRRRAIHGRYSHMTVLGQTHGTASKPGENATRGDARDEAVTSYRPRIIVDHECDTPAIATERARKLLSDSRLKALTLVGVVKGHRIVAPGMPGDGQLWQPGQRVHIKSEPHNIDGTYFLMGRRFTGGKRGGPQTHLVFKEDGAWVLDAHPHKRRHRRGKNDVHAQIIDATKGANQ